MFGTHFYNEGLRKLTIAFGQLFNNIVLQNTSSTGAVTKRIRVPLAYAPKEKFILCKLPRQSGKSTTTISYLLHYALFNPNSNIALLANKSSTARDILSRLQLAYENLPKWLQQGVINWNKGNIELENKSTIVAAATSSSAIRGGSYNIIFLDEFAFVPTNIAEMFFSSVYPTISAGTKTKMIIVSTPYGMNQFYKLWSDAENKKNDYVPIEVHWSEVPGRDQKWKEDTIKKHK